MICFFVFLFFGSLFLSSVGRMIFGSRAVTARRRKPRDRQTDRQRQTDTDRQRQTTRERERHEHSHSVMHTQVSGFKISAVSVFRNSAWLPGRKGTLSRWAQSQVFALVQASEQIVVYPLCMGRKESNLKGRSVFRSEYIASIICMLQGSRCRLGVEVVIASKIDKPWVKMSKMKKIVLTDPEISSCVQKIGGGPPSANTIRHCRASPGQG